MSFYAGRFNLYFTALLALSLLDGCATSSKKKKDEPVGVLRMHVESTANSNSGGQTVSVLRGTPLAVTIANEPILTEAQVVKASLFDAPGGYAVAVQFDSIGTLILEQFSTANLGRHFVIFGQWGTENADGRWLAVPLITKRIGNGILSFTPDMSRDEAQKWVTGLNHYAKKNDNGQ